MDFNDIKENNTCSKFDINKVKNIVEQIENTIKNNVGPIVNLINDDNKLFADNLTYSKLIETIERLKKELWYLEKKSKSLLIEGIGNLGVIYNGNTELLLYLSLKALKTHNNIVFFENDIGKKVNEYIIKIINNILEANNYKTIISIKYIENEKEVSDYQDYFNAFICIGQIDKFYKFKKNIKKDIIYSAYGTLSLYMDNKELKNELLNMDEYIFKNNLYMDLYKDDDVKDVIEKINKKREDFCTVIFTKDIKKAYYFLENVDSQNVYINKNPFNNYEFYLDDIKIIKIKNIII